MSKEDQKVEKHSVQCESCGTWFFLYGKVPSTPICSDCK